MAALFIGATMATIEELREALQTTNVAALIQKAIDS